jgi:hypothetical protein
MQAMADFLVKLLGWATIAPNRQDGQVLVLFVDPRKVEHLVVNDEGRSPTVHWSTSTAYGRRTNFDIVWE